MNWSVKTVVVIGTEGDLRVSVLVTLGKSATLPSLLQKTSANSDLGCTMSLASKAVSIA